MADANRLAGDDKTCVKNKNKGDCLRLKLDEPIDAGSVTTHSAQTAFKKVLKYGGASLVRDECDNRYVEEATNGTTTYQGAVAKRAGILEVSNDPSGTEDPTTASFPSLREEERTTGFDTDGDGMPDDWEVANGLDPNNAEDAQLTTIDSQKEWYTNVEVYLNSLVQTIMIEGNKDAESPVKEYYPAYHNADGTIVEAINSNDTGISGNVTDDTTVVSTTMYDAAGVARKNDAKGVTIHVKTLNNGEKISLKGIK